MSDRVYLKCIAKHRTFSSGGSVINLGFKAEEMIAFCREHANQGGYINLIIAERREVGKYGDTHSVCLDTWQPTRTEAPADTQKPSKASAPLTDTDIAF